FTMTLTDYLTRGKYELVANHLDSYTAIIDYLNIDLNKPQIIGIDGPTNSGKTTFALAFSHWLNIQGKKGTVIHGDSFLIDRNQRNDIFSDIRQGNITIKEYSKLAWQQDNLRD